jgi:hypothetical protein
MYYNLKTTNIYRVPTVEDALRLRKWLEKNCVGELTSFSYKTKYIKSKGEILDEYQVVTATVTIDNEKEPEGVMTVDIMEDM